MQPSARWIAILVFQFLLTTFSFAGDDPKPATSPQESSASDNTSAATAAQSPHTAPKTNHDSMFSSGRGQDTPGGEALFGYSYLRLRTNTGTALDASYDEVEFMPGVDG